MIWWAVGGTSRRVGTASDVVVSVVHSLNNLRAPLVVRFDLEIWRRWGIIFFRWEQSCTVDPIAPSINRQTSNIRVQKKTQTKTQQPYNNRLYCYIIEINT